MILVVTRFNYTCPLHVSQMPVEGPGRLHMVNTATLVAREPELRRVHSEA
jgi:hypothetical protein